MKNNIKQSVIAWNNRFPLDKWWRNKYNISYLSNAHRESTFFGQYYEYYEEIMFKEYYADKDKEREEAKNKIPYKPLSGNWWSGLTSSKSEVDDWFSSPIK